MSEKKLLDWIEKELGELKRRRLESTSLRRDIKYPDEECLNEVKDKIKELAREELEEIKNMKKLVDKENLKPKQPEELKTLKDCKKIYIPEAFFSFINSQFSPQERLVSEDKIKQELGIKWIKEIEKEWAKIKKNNATELKALSLGLETSSNIGIEKRRIELNAMVFILRKVFDITEEDLK